MATEAAQTEQTQPPERLRGGVSEILTSRSTLTDTSEVIELPNVSNSVEGPAILSYGDIDIDDVLEQFLPHHWLTPASLPWDQWDTWIANVAS